MQTSQTIGWRHIPRSIESYRPLSAVGRVTNENEKYGQAWTAKRETKFPGNSFMKSKKIFWDKFRQMRKKSKTKLGIESGIWHRNHFLYFQIGETESIWDEISEYFSMNFGFYFSRWFRWYYNLFLVNRCSSEIS